MRVVVSVWAIAASSCWSVHALGPAGGAEVIAPVRQRRGAVLRGPRLAALGGADLRAHAGGHHANARRRRQHLRAARRRAARSLRRADLRLARRGRLVAQPRYPPATSRRRNTSAAAA